MKISKNIKKQIELEAFLEALNKQEHKKNIKLNVEGEKTKDGYELKIKSISVSKELYKEIGFDDKIAVIDGSTIGGTVVKKQPTTRELLEKLAITVDNGFKSVNKRLDNLEARVAKIEVSLEEVRSLPTIQKELVQSKAKSR